MRLKACDSCLVYGSDKRPLARARVVELEEDKLRLYFTNRKLRSVHLKALVDFYDAHEGLVRCVGDMMIKQNYSPTEPWVADCEIVKIYESTQRQKDLRVKLNTRLEFSSGGRFFSGVVQNISAGGMRLATAEDMSVGQFFEMTYRFKTIPREVNAKILRKQEIPDLGFAYGCQFRGLPKDTEADIRNFIYVTQIEKDLERKRKLEIALEENV